MARYTNEFKRKIVDEKLIKGKSYPIIEQEFGVLRGTVYQWVRKYEEGTLFIDKRTIKDKQEKEKKEYEFLKKSFALLKEIRSKQQE